MSITNNNNKIHVSISMDAETDPIEFYFLSDKLTWDNLVQLIQSTTSNLSDPIILYFKRRGIESLENQQQLESLLASFEGKGLRLYGAENLVQESVFYVGAFLRLGEFVEQHKSIVVSSRRLARWVGILASLIAQDTEDYDFDYEFGVLETMVKEGRRRGKQAAGVTTDDATFVVIDDDQEKQGGEKQQNPREALFGHAHLGRGFFFGGGRRFGKHHGGLHHPSTEFLDDREGGPSFAEAGFGGRGGKHGHFGGKHHYFGEEGFLGHHFGGKHHGPFGHHGHHLGEVFGGRGGRGGHRHHFGGRGGYRGPFGYHDHQLGEISGGRGGRGGYRHHFGGRGGHHGGPFSGHDEEIVGKRGRCPARDTDELRGYHSAGEKGARKYRKRCGGMHHRGFSSSEESDDELRAFGKHHKLKKHHNRHGHHSKGREFHHHSVA